MKKTDLPQSGEGDKNKSKRDLYGRWYCIEHFSEPREIKKTKGTTLDMFDGSLLANWFRENEIVGVL